MPVTPTKIPPHEAAHKIQKLIHSSRFRYGDNTSFSVPLEPTRNHRLPGRSDPATYLDKLKLTAPLPKKVAIVCAGNGGLVAECLIRGATQITIYEPRNQFHLVLPEILDLLAFAFEYQIDLKCDWPGVDSMGLYDLVLFPEGPDLLLKPKSQFGTIANMIAPGGALYMEICHGDQAGPVPEKINRWAPTPQAMFNALPDIFTLTEIGNGRLERRMAYKIEHDKVNAPATTTVPATATETVVAVVEATAKAGLNALKAMRGKKTAPAPATKTAPS